jgi:RNA polymerase sporulation-specific sigma factor
MDCLTTSELSNPEEIAISKESAEIFKKKIDTLLSEFEKKVLVMFLNGDSYESIANTLNKETKAIDNALQRVKRKLKNA